MNYYKLQFHLRMTHSMDSIYVNDCDINFTIKLKQI